jgi:cytochrome c553
MFIDRFLFPLALIIVSAFVAMMANVADANETLYSEHCASCHGADRLGGMGPALLPENLSRLKRTEAEKSISQGRIATQMPAFQDKLNSEQIQSIMNFIYTPPTQMPEMGLPQIQATHVIHNSLETLPNKPLFEADPLNLFLVVEMGDHHATILDGDKLEPIFRFPTRFALHGGPKYSPDGRFVYLASRDGWVSKFDLYNLKYVAEIRAGINTRNIAVSADGKTVIAANYLPRTLVLLDAEDLKPLQLIDVKDEKGNTSRVSAVYTAPPRNSFIVAFKDITEVWEIPYNNKETSSDKRQFSMRRIALDTVLDDFFFDPPYQHLIGASREGNQGQVINLVEGRKVTNIEIPGMPHLGSGINWVFEDQTILATPNLKENVISFISLNDWKVFKRLETAGAGFFMRSHQNSRYAWTDAMLSKNKDKIHVIDKQTLEIAKTLQPSVGKTAAHVEFDRYGKYVLLSISEMDGALIIYDAKTLEEIKRLPMKKPSGKYNVYNKINYESGTSH